MVAFLFSDVGSSPKRQLRLSLLPQADGAVRLLGTVYLVRSSFFTKQETELSGSDLPPVVAYLEEVKQGLH